MTNESHLDSKKIPHTYKVESEGGLFQSIIPIMCLCLTGFLIFFVIRQLQGASGKAMSFGKSRARMMDDKDKKITFADVAGAEEAKESTGALPVVSRNSGGLALLGGI